MKVTRVSFRFAEGEVTIGDENNISSSSVHFVVRTLMGLVGEVGRSSGDCGVSSVSLDRNC